MVNPNVAWQKYLNSSNTSINRYLKTYGDSLLHQTFRFKESEIVSKIGKEDYIPALEHLLNLCTKLEKYEMCRDIHNELKLLKLKKARGRTPKAKVTVT
jgi:hypothetical protein